MESFTLGDWIRTLSDMVAFCQPRQKTKSFFFEWQGRKNEGKKKTKKNHLFHRITKRTSDEIGGGREKKEILTTVCSYKVSLVGLQGELNKSNSPLFLFLWWRNEKRELYLSLSFFSCVFMILLMWKRKKKTELSQKIKAAGLFSYFAFCVWVNLLEWKGGRSETYSR